ncbi:MAG: LTA synthase family protein [Oscillospiraceae bacterium]|nr:LTA synthase family protein [Oscillospiraceae bacterium]
MKKRKEKQTEPVLVLNKRLPDKKRILFLLWQFFLLLVGCGLLTYFTLRLSYSNLNPDIWLGYWEDLWIPFINFALIFSLCLALFALIGRAWIAYLVSALIWLGIAIGNYYLIIIRSDPLQFQDLTCLREALAITGTQGYELELSSRVIIPVSGAVGYTVLLALLSRWKPRWKSIGRAIGICVAALALTGALVAACSGEMLELTKHYDHVNTWSSTEIYASRGVAYSFTRSAFTASGKPADYSKSDAESALAKYTETDIPADRKADIFVIMRESYADLSELSYDTDALDLDACYENYHGLVQESVCMGNLVTNGFGGNTKDAERGFLTGNYRLSDWRKPTNSYLWYLKQQGYRTEGAHPFNGWFYNRLNVDRYLGFDSYKFREDGFDDLVGADKIAEDDVLYSVIWEQYQKHLETDGSPYFNFSVTYEGHGPYNYSRNLYPGRYVQKNAKTADGYAMNNYLGCCAKRDDELQVLIDHFRDSDRPIVLLVYGDHKATLGKDINNYTTAAYTRFGMDVSLSSEDGFFNYYSTDYVIWMNSAARTMFGCQNETLKQGPVISPCYLMNVLFDTLGWGKGPAYLQAMGDMMEEFPVFSTKGRVSVDGHLTTKISSSHSENYHLMQTLCYYWQTEFLYEEQE